MRAAWLLWLWPVAAGAFDLGTFRPATAVSPFVGLEVPRPDPGSLLLALDYGRTPLREGPETDFRHAARLHLVGGWSPARRWVLQLAGQVVHVDGQPGQWAPIDGGALGDTRLRAGFTALDGRAIRVALGLRARLPTATLGGALGRSGGGGADAAVVLRPGPRLRLLGSAAIEALTARRSRLAFDAGVAWSPTSGLWLPLELGTAPWLDPPHAATRPAEVRLGLRARTARLHVGVSVGAALNNGPGVPAWRGLLTAGFVASGARRPAPRWVPPLVGEPPPVTAPPAPPVAGVRPWQSPRGPVAEVYWPPSPAAWRALERLPRRPLAVRPRGRLGAPDAHPLISHLRQAGHQVALAPDPGMPSATLAGPSLAGDRIEIWVVDDLARPSAGLDVPN